MPSEIGKRIRELRTRAGESQEALAHVLGVSREMVSQYENGDVKDYPLSRILAIADHYMRLLPETGCDACWLIFGKTFTTQIVNADLLEYVITEALMALSTQRMVLPPDKMAKFISYFYDYALKAPDKKVSGTELARVLHLVA